VLTGLIDRRDDRAAAALSGALGGLIELRPAAASNVFLGAVTAIALYVGWRMAHVSVDLDGDVLAVRNVPCTLRVRCDEVLAVDKDCVLSDWTIRARRTEDGTEVEWRGLSICELRDGKITWWREHHLAPPSPVEY
jgi:hypothetical protein